MVGENTPAAGVALRADLAQDSTDGQSFRDLAFDRLLEAIELVGLVASIGWRRTTVFAEDATYDFARVTHSVSDLPGAIVGMQLYDLVLNLLWNRGLHSAWFRWLAGKSVGLIFVLVHFGLLLG